MDFSALKLVLRDERFPLSFLPDFVSLMQKFEVILLLDKNHLLIPSLLPVSVNNSCVVLPFTVQMTHENLANTEELNRLPFVSIGSLNMQLFTRYYLLPYIPNGFFSRLIARIIGSNISTCISQCVSRLSIQEDSVFNSLHWRCWRDGIVLVFRYMEIIRVSSTSLPYPDTNKVYISSVKKTHTLEQSQKGIEILVACLPDSIVMNQNDFFSCHDSNSYNRHLSVWVLRQLADIIDSVFDDWYEGFSRRKGFDLRIVQQVNPCPLCLSSRLNAKCKAEGTNRKGLTQSLSFDSSYSSGGYISFFDVSTQSRNMHLFTSSYCVLAASKRESLKCNDHGLIGVPFIAPDLVSSMKICDCFFISIRV